MSHEQLFGSELSVTQPAMMPMTRTRSEVRMVRGFATRVPVINVYESALWSR
jgi:hypothetical protein